MGRFKWYLVGSLLICIVLQGLLKIQQGFTAIIRRRLVTGEYLTANNLYLTANNFYPHKIHHHALRMLLSSGMWRHV
jgi:hypothetical protein